MGKRIVVAGHICLDITPVFSQTGFQKEKEIFTSGKLINMQGVDVHTGGVVSNSGLGLMMLGASVTLMGMVGKDDFGNIILDQLKKYHLDEEMIVSDNASTSYSIVLAPPGTDRIFLHDPGANDFFGFQDLDFDKIEGAALFHFGYPPVMRKMYEKDGQELVKILKQVKEMGVSTSVDMAAIDENSAAGNVDWLIILEKILPYVDFFVPSLEELCFMIDKKLYHELRKRAGTQDMTLFASREEIDMLAERLLVLGAKVVLIKCGVSGMYLKTAEEKILDGISQKLQLDRKEWSNISHFEESYVPDKVLSATGAGDTSCAAFLYALTEGFPWEMCLKLATGTGALCVTKYDAISGLKPLKSVLEKINQGWEKQHVTKR